MTITITRSLAPILVVGSLAIGGCASRNSWDYSGTPVEPFREASVLTASEIDAFPPSMSLEDIMVQRIPGLRLVSTGEGASRVSISRLSSTRNASAALYIVDGVPLTSTVHINARDVERVQVIKDAAEIALYGFRGMNGVILITSRNQ